MWCDDDYESWYDNKYEDAAYMTKYDGNDGNDWLISIRFIILIEIRSYHKYLNRNEKVEGGWVEWKYVYNAIFDPVLYVLLLNLYFSHSVHSIKNTTRCLYYIFFFARTILLFFYTNYSIRSFVYYGENYTWNV